MDEMVSFDAILFPADERAPHLVPLMTSNASSVPPLGQSGSRPPPHPMAKVPHPEMYMDFVAEVAGGRAWEHHVSFLPPLTRFLLVSIRPRLSNISPFIFLLACLVRFRSGG